MTLRLQAWLRRVGAAAAIAVAMAAAVSAPVRAQAQNATPASIVYLLTEPQYARLPEIRVAFAAAMRDRGLGRGDVEAVRFAVVRHDADGLAEAARAIRGSAARVVIVPTFVALASLLAHQDRPPLVFFAAVGNLFDRLPTLARPGEARATGVNAWGAGMVESKMLELLQLARPGLASVCVLGARETGTTGMHASLERHATSRAIAAELYPVDRLADLDRYVARRAFGRCDGFIVYAHAAFDEDPRRYIATLGRLGLPAVHATPGASRAGALVTVEPDLRRLREHAWDQVAAIYRGQSLASLPVYQADTYRIGINVPALRHLARPPDKRLLLRADDFHYD